MEIDICFCGNCSKELVEIPQCKEIDDIIYKDIENAYKHDIDLLVNACIKAMEEHYKKKMM